MIMFSLQAGQELPVACCYKIWKLPAKQIYAAVMVSGNLAICLEV
jgi:hypothetical protein